MNLLHSLLLFISLAFLPHQSTLNNNGLSTMWEKLDRKPFISHCLSLKLALSSDLPGTSRRKVMQQFGHRELFQNLMLSDYGTKPSFFALLRRPLETAMYLEILEPDTSHLFLRDVVTTSPLLGNPSTLQSLLPLFRSGSMPPSGNHSLPGVKFALSYHFQNKTGP